MSNIEHSSIPLDATVSFMETGIQILAIELDGTDGIIITFSDGTSGGYVVEELLEMRPIRERARTTKTTGAPIVFSNH